MIVLSLFTFNTVFISMSSVHHLKLFVKRHWELFLAKKIKAKLQSKVVPIVGKSQDWMVEYGITSDTASPTKRNLLSTVGDEKVQCDAV